MRSAAGGSPVEDCVSPTASSRQLDTLSLSRDVGGVAIGQPPKRAREELKRALPGVRPRRAPKPNRRPARVGGRLGQHSTNYLDRCNGNRSETRSDTQRLGKHVPVVAVGVSVFRHAHLLKREASDPTSHARSGNSSPGDIRPRSLTWAFCRQQAAREGPADRRPGDRRPTILYLVVRDTRRHNMWACVTHRDGKQSPHGYSQLTSKFWAKSGAFRAVVWITDREADHTMNFSPPCPALCVFVG